MLRAILDLLRRALNVYSPLAIVESVVPGIVTGAIDANDALGAMGVFEGVPEYGMINWAHLVDPDDDTLALTVHIFNDSFTAVAHGAAYDLSVPLDIRKHVTDLDFGSVVDHISAKSHEVFNHNAHYHAPGGKLYYQCSSTGTPNIAAGLEPSIQLGILPGRQF